MPIPAASFLTPASQLENFDGLFGVSQVAANAGDEASRRAADRQGMESFTVRTPWVREEKETYPLSLDSAMWDPTGLRKSCVGAIKGDAASSINRAAHQCNS